MKWFVLFMVYWLVGWGTVVSVENHRGPYETYGQHLIAIFVWPAQWAKLATDIAIKQTEQRNDQA